MKRMKFTELGFKKNLDTLIVVVGIICLVIGLICVFAYPESKFGSLAGLSYPQFKTFFYKNYFVWNKKGGILKINSKSKNIDFSELNSFEFSENQLTLIKKDKTQLNFFLYDINSEDIIKIKGIIAKHIKN